MTAPPPGNQIVQVSTTVALPPAPATLQETGAIISQGATNLSPYGYALLTELSSLAPLLNGAAAIASMTLGGGTVTVTTSAPHGLPIGETFVGITIAGVTPTAYNGFQYCTITGASTFTYPLSGSPGAVSVQGVWTVADVATLVSQCETFFAQGTNGITQAVYVLELGPGNATAGVAALAAYIAENPNTSYRPGATGFFYAYLVPRAWDSNSNFLALIATLENPSARTYFFVTTNLNNYINYTNLMKPVFALVEAPQWGTWLANALTAITWSGNVTTATTTTAHGVSPGDWFQISGCANIAFNGWWLATSGTTGSTLQWSQPSNPGSDSPPPGTLVASFYPSAGIPGGETDALFPNVSFTEFTMAGPFYWWLNQNPGPTTPVPQFAFTFIYGVTAFPPQGTNSLLTTLRSANINFITSASEGGIAQNMIVWGRMCDGNPINFWYAADWVEINLDIDTANAVIEGSQPGPNPLYYNQPGIDRLQAVGANVLARGVINGLINATTILQTSLDQNTFITNLNSGAYAGMAVINAIPFAIYSAEAPSDYAAGRYAGFTAVFIAQNGFDQIIYQVVVSEIVAI